MTNNKIFGAVVTGDFDSYIQYWENGRVHEWPDSVGRRSILELLWRSIIMKPELTHIVWERDEDKFVKKLHTLTWI